MRPLTQLSRSILIAAPIWALFGLMIYLFSGYYDFLFDKFIGQVLVIPTFLLGVYSIALPVSSSKTLKKSGWETAVQKHLKPAWFSHIPWGFGIVTVAWSWIVYSQMSLYWAAETRFPMDLAFVMACLLIVNEGLRTFTRKKHLDLYIQAQEDSTAGKQEDYVSATKWSIPQLKLAFYLLPIIHVFGGWTVMVLVFYTIRTLTAEFLSNDLQAIILMTTGGAIWYVFIRYEKKVEQWARDNNYIPWFSEWNSEKGLL